MHFYPNGMVMDSGFYSKGKSIGTSISWHLNGFMKDSSFIDTTGKGLRITWFDDGGIASAGYLVNFTKSHGTWQFYHKNGQLNAKETYQNERLIKKLYMMKMEKQSQIPQI